MKWNLKEVKEIEHHVKTSTNCQHPRLEDLVVTGLCENERSTPLLMACRHGDLEAVKRIVDVWGINVCTATVHCHTPWPRLRIRIRIEEVTPLFVAASNCHTKIVRYLVEKGANVNSRTHAQEKVYSGMTPVYAATVLSKESVDDERISTIRFLLESGADPSLITDDGRPIWLNFSLSSQITTLLVEWGWNFGQRAPHSGVTIFSFLAYKVTDNPQDSRPNAPGKRC